MTDRPGTTCWQDWMRRARQQNVTFVIDAQEPRPGMGRTSMALRTALRMEQDND